jgi:dihydrofolate reductase
MEEGKMGRAVLYIAMSLDGYVAGRDDDISWLLPYNDVDYGFDAFFAGIGAIIQGRRAHDIETQHGWNALHARPTFVLTRRPPPASTGGEFFYTAGDVGEVLQRAKQLSEKDIWIEGGANVAQQYLRRRLVDDMVVTIAPTLLGEGIPLFERHDQRLPLTLREVRQFDRGLVQLHYTFDST